MMLERRHCRRAPKGRSDRRAFELERKHVILRRARRVIAHQIVLANQEHFTGFAKPLRTVQHRANTG